MTKQIRVGLIGARGHVGKELLPLLLSHPHVDLNCVSSRELAGQNISVLAANYEGDLQFENLSPESVAQKQLDACFLALPNGYSYEFVQALEGQSSQSIIIDLSGDHRFDDHWTYGLTEYNRDDLKKANRISNPGCYATAMQLAIRPFLDLIDSAPVCFGISGYSGAGTKPSAKNDQKVLKDNLLPYALANHLHEEEVSRHVQTAVHFSPHVASFFRGISMTVRLTFSHSIEYAEVMQRLNQAYQNEALVKVMPEIPEVKHNANQHFAVVGGATLADQGKRLVLVSTIDNLLKGAATQAIQNMNLACGFDELLSIPMNSNEVSA